MAGVGLLPPAGFAAREHVGDGHEDGDDGLRGGVSMGCVGAGRGEGLTLMMALQTATMALTTAMKQDVMACTTLLNCEGRQCWSRGVVFGGYLRTQLATAPMVAVVEGVVGGSSS